MISYVPSSHVAIRVLNGSAASLVSCIAILFPCLPYFSCLPESA